MILLSAGTLAAGDLLTTPSANAGEQSRPAAMSGQESNVVVGVGLVIGLPGTGDAALDQAFVEETIVGVLRRAGLNLWNGQIEPGRVAKVIATAELSAGSKDGMRVPVTVMAIGDASSLAGGVLLVTPLRDADGKVYAIGEGRIEVGNQVASVELSEEPGLAARIGRLADGAVLDADHASTVALD